MKQLMVPLLVAWAVVATWLALRQEPSPPPTRSAAEAEELAALRLQVENLRQRLAEVPEAAERAAESGSKDAPDPAAPKTFGEAAETLLLEYRRLHVGREDLDHRSEISRRLLRQGILERLATRAAADREILLVLPLLLREALDEDEVDDIVTAFEELAHPDPGGRIDVRLRAELRAVLTEASKPFRRVAAANQLMWRARPTPEDFGVVLDVARREGDPETREGFMDALSDEGLREIASPAQAVEYTEMLRNAFAKDEWGWATTLSRWSEERDDFDRILDQLREYPVPSLLWALRGGVALTKGRETECRAALTEVVANEHMKRGLRVTAVTILDGLRPWDETTTKAVERFQLGDK